MKQLICIGLFLFSILSNINGQKSRNENNKENNQYSLGLSYGYLLFGHENEEFDLIRYGVDFQIETEKNWILNFQYSIDRYSTVIEDLATITKTASNYKVAFGKALYERVGILSNCSFGFRNNLQEPFIYPPQEFDDKYIRIGLDLFVGHNFSNGISLRLGMDLALLEYGEYKRTRYSPILLPDERVTVNNKSEFFGKESFISIGIAYVL